MLQGSTGSAAVRLQATRGGDIVERSNFSRRQVLCGTMVTAASMMTLSCRVDAWSTPLSYPFSGAAADRNGVAPLPGTCQGRSPGQTEGPFYVADTPRRADLRAHGTDAGTLVLEGQVQTPGCQPVAGAVIDIWHCDENGHYDNSGFGYRGHQFTDRKGVFRFVTIRPGHYPGRTPHIHVKVQGPSTRLLTTQVYFPDQGDRNARDRIYRDELQIRLSREDGAWRGRFDFVLEPVA